MGCNSHRFLERVWWRIWRLQGRCFFTVSVHITNGVLEMLLWSINDKKIYSEDCKWIKWSSLKCKSPLFYYYFILACVRVSYKYSKHNLLAVWLIWRYYFIFIHHYTLPFSSSSLTVWPLKCAFFKWLLLVWYWVDYTANEKKIGLEFTLNPFSCRNCL